MRVLRPGGQVSRTKCIGEDIYFGLDAETEPARFTEHAHCM